MSPLHKLAGRVSLSVWSTLWEGDYRPHEAPGEDELYDVCLGALTRALQDPKIRRDLAQAVKQPAKGATHGR